MVSVVFSEIFLTPSILSQHDVSYLDLPEKKSHRRHSLPLPKAANSNISPGEKPRKTPHEKTTPTKPIIQVASGW